MIIVTVSIVTNFKSQECSACANPSVTVSTEIVSVEPVTKAIKKAYLFRCKSHINVSVEDMLLLREVKSVPIDANDIEFTIVESEKTKNLGVHVGVQVKHIPSGITVQCTYNACQHQNKRGAIELLKRELSKR